jgi:flagellar protein FlaG
MASVSVSHLILFIASMLIAASVAGVFTSSVDELAGAIDDRGVQVSDNVRTDIEIISDGGSDTVYNSNGNDNVTLLVKNIGTNDLVVSDTAIDVLINGRFQGSSDVDIELLGEGETWSPDEVVRINATQSLSDGDHRAKVIVNDAEAVFEFRVSGGS